MSQWRPRNRVHLLFKNPKINTRHTAFLIVYTVVWLAGFCCLIWVFFGRLMKFSITLWAYVTFFPSVAFFEQCFSMVMLKGFFQHFLILRFLLLFCIPEVWSWIFARAYTVTPCATTMFAFRAYFEFSRFIYSRHSRLPTDRKWCDLGLQYTDQWSEVRNPPPVTDVQPNLGEVTTVHSCFNFITQIIVHTFLSKNKPGCIWIKNTEHYIINNRILRTINWISITH